MIDPHILEYLVEPGPKPECSCDCVVSIGYFFIGLPVQALFFFFCSFSVLLSCFHSSLPFFASIKYIELSHSLIMPLLFLPFLFLYCHFSWIWGGNENKLVESVYPEPFYLNI